MRQQSPTYTLDLGWIDEQKWYEVFIPELNITVVSETESEAMTAAHNAIMEVLVAGVEKQT